MHVPTKNNSQRHTLLRLAVFLLACLTAFCGCVSTSGRSEPLASFSSSDDTPVNATGSPSPQKKRVAITFDDGPQYNNPGQNTQALVDELDRYGFHATFFVLGNRIGNGDALKYAVDHGNEIGIHGLTHEKYFDTCNDSVYEQELSQTATRIRSVLPDYEVRLMRPPGGRISSTRLASCPYAVIGWSIDSDDWNHRYYAGISDADAEAEINAIVENVMSAVNDGDIILMHDIYQSSFDAAKAILKKLYDEGYDVVTVSELFGGTPAAGHEYTYAPPIA